MSAELNSVLRKVLREVTPGTSLVLKGGFALAYAYGSERETDDLDFDAERGGRIKAHIVNAVKRLVPHAVVDLVKDTDTDTRLRIRYPADGTEGRFKIEVSYRTPCPPSEKVEVDGVAVAAPTRLIEGKLSAAHDGTRTRTKARDMYDLDFLSRRFEADFTRDQAIRLAEFAADPVALVQRYIPAFKEAAELNVPPTIVDDMALNLALQAEHLRAMREREFRIESLKEIAASQGPGAPFAVRAMEALKSNGGDTSAVDWKTVHSRALDKAKRAGFSYDETMQTLSEISPALVTEHDRVAFKPPNNTHKPGGSRKF
ncbi:MAG TPA: nucleotidyl transferase AbiEii/AbiGii toxin family protein [Candidatus Baltobacteraceae bacterium]|jgi:predicted nucleotidyltransferase component of viral defense system|nr:nucleotidyl transferase AbiEii/AbiGii toxin family protein [Candidatus Baltobacteraceae bacterium]